MNRPPIGRTLRALAASFITGVVIYVVVLRIALPRIGRHLSDGQIAWLRRSFMLHPAAVLAALALIAAVLALPVLLAFRLAFGPMTGMWRRSRQ